MYIEKRVPNLHSADGWEIVKSKFLTYFNPLGSTIGTTNTSMERNGMET